MLGSRSRVARLCSGIAVAIQPACVSPSHAESLQDIEGLSVKIDYKVQATRVTPTGQLGYMNADVAINFYISSKANIFLYPSGASIQSDTGNEVKAQGGPTVIAIDKAGEQKYGQMNAWTMINGHLTNIIKFVEGYAVTTIAIDPARLICTFDRQYYSDPKTGRVISNLTGPPVQIQSYKVTSYTCTVKKGNVFASN
jgi:hypothetical protein